MKVEQQLPLAQSAVIPRLVYYLLAPSLVFLTSLVLYLTTLTQVHTFDALSYGLAVDNKSWQELFHPHHLAYGPLGALVRQIAQAIGWPGSAVVPMQITNALAGAVGVALFFALIRALTQRAGLALGGALLLGGSYAYWYYAVEVEVYTIAAVLLIGCLGLLVRFLDTPTPRLCFGLGLVQGAAILFHQTNVLLCIPVGVALLYASCGSWGRATLRLWLAYVLPLVAVVGGAYLLVGVAVSELRSVEAFVAWITSYAQTGWWGGPVSGDNWQRLGVGLSSALAHPFGAWLWLLLSGLVLLQVRPLLRSYRLLTVTLLSWLLVYGAFFFWWEPDNAEFWIASLPPFFLLVVLAVHTATPTRTYRSLWVGGVLAIGAVMLTGNYNAVMLRGSGAYSPQFFIGEALANVSTADDLLLVPDGLQALYLEYYSGSQNAVSLSHYLHTNQGDWAASCTQVQQRIEEALSSGVAVYIGEGVLRPGTLDPRYYDPLAERFQLTSAMLDRCLAAYLPDLVPIALGAGLPSYYQLPAATEKLAGGGWAFTHSRWGWQTGNAYDESFAGGIWSFIPEPDPYIVSPEMPIDTDIYWAVQVRLAKGVENREAQIFFMDQTGIIEEARSVRWELANHADLKTYHLDLRDHPAWTGTIYGLRIDPSLGPDEDEGERIRVAWVRLLSYTEYPPDPDD